MKMFYDDEPEEDIEGYNYDDNDESEDEDIERENYDEDEYNEDDRSEFEQPYSNSALRKATTNNPRVYPCPTCKQPNRLTPKDIALGYQCDECADLAENGGF